MTSLIPWRLYALIGALAATLAGMAYVNHLRHRVVDLKTEAATATTQGDINQAGADISATRAAETATVFRKAEEGRRAVQNATDLNDVLAEWSAALDGVRTPSGPGPDPAPGQGRPDADR